MTAPKKKAPTKKAAPEKAPAKKAAPKKAPAKKVAPKVERERKNGVLTPLPTSATGKVFAICDRLSAKAGEPAARADVLKAGEKAGIKAGTVTAAYQIWRNYHGLVKKRG